MKKTKEHKAWVKGWCLELKEWGVEKDAKDLAEIIVSTIELYRKDALVEGYKKAQNDVRKFLLLED